MSEAGGGHTKTSRAAGGSKAGFACDCAVDTPQQCVHYWYTALSGDTVGPTAKRLAAVDVQYIIDGSVLGRCVVQLIVSL